MMPGLQRKNISAIIHPKIKTRKIQKSASKEGTKPGRSVPATDDGVQDETAL